MKGSALILLAISKVMSSGRRSTAAASVAFATASSDGDSSANKAKDNETNEVNSEVPLLPEPPKDSNLPSAKLGETIRFEELRPVILNLDGSRRRISNWDQMTDHEQKVTWRRISKRNEERRMALLEKAKAEDDSGAQKDDEL